MRQLKHISELEASVLYEDTIKALLGSKITRENTITKNTVYNKSILWSKAAVDTAAIKLNPLSTVSLINHTFLPIISERLERTKHQNI